MTRTFEFKPAVRERTPLLLGIVGPSGSGKTYSSLRLAVGIQRVVGGKIAMVDTEARRGLHYASKFRAPDGSPGYIHAPFGAPFGSLDYLDALEAAYKLGAKVIIVDSMSHEHDGPGGLLEQHAAEVHRLAGDDWKKAERVKMLAWQKPKAARRRLLNTVLQMSCNFIFNFRAKEKLKMVPGKEPEQLGWMPIAGDEFVYEMTAKFLLLPGVDGLPTWTSDFAGEKAMMKRPDQFRELFANARQLDEKLGEDMARWAEGDGATVATASELAASYAACSDAATLRGLEDSRRALWGKASKAEKETLKTAADAAQKRLDDATAAMTAVLPNPETREPGSDDGKPPSADEAEAFEKWKAQQAAASGGGNGQ